MRCKRVEIFLGKMSSLARLKDATEDLAALIISFGGDRDPSASTGFFKCLNHSLKFSGFDKPCRGKFFNEVEHGICEYITDVFQFLEDGLDDSLDVYS